MGSRAVRALQEIRKRINPDVCFLSETHLDIAKADNVRRRAGFDQTIVYESDGRSGGLLLMWKDEINVRTRGITKNYIDVTIEEDGGLWEFMVNQSGARKQELGMQLGKFKQDMMAPWFLMGDFNEILYNSEKEGGRPRT